MQKVVHVEYDELQYLVRILVEICHVIVCNNANARESFINMEYIRVVLREFIQLIEANERPTATTVVTI